MVVNGVLLRYDMLLISCNFIQAQGNLVANINAELFKKGKSSLPRKDQNF